MTSEVTVRRCIYGEERKIAAFVFLFGVLFKIRFILLPNDYIVTEKK